MSDPESVICPLLTCAQPVGSPCLTADNRIASRPHVVRLHLAEQKQAPAILGHFVGMDEAETLRWRYDRKTGLSRDAEPIVLDMVSHDEASRRLAIRWALVQLVTDLEERTIRDRKEACEANGWRMSDASDLYDRTIRDVTGLVEGTIDAQDFLAEATRRS